MKNAFCKRCVTICRRFCLNEGGVAGYGNWMKAKYTVNEGVQVAGMIFQTRFSNNFKRRQEFHLISYIKGTVAYKGKDSVVIML